MIAANRYSLRFASFYPAIAAVIILISCADIYAGPP